MTVVVLDQVWAGQVPVVHHRSKSPLLLVASLHPSSGRWVVVSCGSATRWAVVPSSSSAASLPPSSRSSALSAGTGRGRGTGCQQNALVGVSSAGVSFFYCVPLSLDNFQAARRCGQAGGGHQAAVQRPAIRLEVASEVGTEGTSAQDPLHYLRSRSQL